MLQQGVGAAGAGRPQQDTRFRGRRRFLAAYEVQEIGSLLPVLAPAGTRYGL
jgi:hypothetical protein